MKRWLLTGAMVLALPMQAQAFVGTSSSTATYQAKAVKSVQATQMQPVLQNAMSKRQSKVSLTYRGNFKDVSGHLREAIEAALRTDEYLTYDYRGYSAEWRGINGSVQIIVTLRYSQTLEQVKYVDAQVKKLAPQIVNATMDAHEKVKAIHDYVVTHTTYDTAMNQAINSPYYALTTGKTLCNGYAMLTYKLLKEAGIPVRLISGEADGIGHVWNLVQLDGQWYHLDTTWDDPLPDKGEISYDYYLLSDAMIAPDHHFKNGGLNQHDLPYPKATTSYENVLRDSGRTGLAQSLEIAANHAKTPEQLTAALTKQLARFEPVVTVAYHGDPATIKASVQRALATPDVQSAQLAVVEQPRLRGIKTAVLNVKYNATLRDVLVEPATLTAGDSPQLKVTALMSNGATFDVTREAKLTSSPNVSVEQGRLLAKSVGTSTVTASFRGQTTANAVTVNPLPKRLYYPLAHIASQGTQFNVAPTAEFSFTFDEAVASANVHAMTAYGEAVAVSTSTEGNVLRVTPAERYPQGTVYVIAQDVVSVTGKAMQAQSYRITIQ